jgi:hemoglobin
LIRIKTACMTEVPASLSPPRVASAAASLCTAAEVRRLVEEFYLQVERDPELGPVFARHVQDWPAHLDQLTAFWNGLLRGQSGFSGAPLARHLAIDGLRWSLFERWLQLFEQTARAQGNVAMATLAVERARRIGGHFWLQYQQARGLAGGPVLD